MCVKKLSQEKYDKSENHIRPAAGTERETEEKRNKN